jgi:hypothetical protein
MSTLFLPLSVGAALISAGCTAEPGPSVATTEPTDLSKQVLADGSELAIIQRDGIGPSGASGPLTLILTLRHRQQNEIAQTALWEFPAFPSLADDVATDERILILAASRPTENRIVYVYLLYGYLKFEAAEQDSSGRWTVIEPLEPANAAWGIKSASITFSKDDGTEADVSLQGTMTKSPQHAHLSIAIGNNGVRILRVTKVQG